MIKIGLTGGIGSGKSTVSKMLTEKGFKVIDSDDISRDVLIKYPEILEKIKIEFGSGFFDWRGEFRRREFGNHIFRFPKQRKKYEDIIIPYIKKEIFLELDKYERNGESMVILDAPTLIENDLHTYMDYIIVVWVDNNTQIMRIKNRDKLSRDEAINRLNAQISLDRKKEYAHIIIDNNNDLLKTKKQVDKVIDFLKVINK
ncbi:dephospho-CoA kinase [Clostridium sp. C8]|jgi:dephospho-CoA kinase|uniref:Dephospho-CoA kinase n=1 Tax=bioreactor metagenome TaxID=1076179 RepID=A0A644XWZ6_9ZZZZ|nr:dephospho-CoA kinase [Clostridium sp. C8]KLE16187.1 dephospho-CoA kinase [Clostridium sp. C8]